MATLWGSLKGSRGQTSRCGTKKSGMRAKIYTLEGAVGIEVDVSSGKVIYKVIETHVHDGGVVEETLVYSRVMSEERQLELPHVGG